MRSVLFTGRRNAARSVMAETCFNAAMIPGWRAFSGGWQPQMEIDPLALKVLAANGFPVDSLSSKPVEIFTQTGAPAVDLCVFLDVHLPDDAEGYPGEHLHWSVPDPSNGEAGKAGYEAALTLITARISTLILSGRLLGKGAFALAS